MRGSDLAISSNIVKERSLLDGVHAFIQEIKAEGRVDADVSCGEIRSKLTMNAMGNGISACTGMSSKAMIESGTARRVSIRLAGEAIRIGHALGYTLESIRGEPPEKWGAAADGDAAAGEEIERAMLLALARMSDEGRPSTGQDMLKGRRTEIDFLNGLVAAKGEEVGIPAPTHAALTHLVRQVERGEIDAHPRNLETL